MSSIAVARKKKSSSPPVIPLAFVAVLGGVALFVILLVAVALGFEMVYYGEVYPGVSVAGVDLSGMTPAEAVTALSQHVTYPQNGKIVFREGSQIWIAKPSEVGLSLDAETSALAAYSVGRSGDPLSRLVDKFSAWYSGVELPPVLNYDERIAERYLEKIADQFNKPTIEASLSVKGVDVVVHPGQVGRTLDVQATLAPLDGQLRTLTDGILPLVVHETTPAVLDVAQQAEVAREILSAPLVLQLPQAQQGDPGPWTFEPKQLAGMLAIERVESSGGAHYQVGLNTKGLRAFLEDLAPKLARDPSDARFTFNDQTRQLEVIQHAVIGRSLNVDATIKNINEKLVQGEHNIPLSVKFTTPRLSDDVTAEQLGITELVSSQTTYFYGSSSPRMHNIETAASRFNGVLVPPGATFSMADILGDVSLDTGYAEALIIYGNRTIQGVGGGVCQVSTTLFRTVFFGGYPVVERHPHAYRVYYYEQNSGGQNNSKMAGLDATVYVPVVDFKFKNDSPNWLLMETDTNKARHSLTWQFYSTSDGRTVDWNTTGLQNKVEPPDPLYQENPDLSKGEIKQVDWAVEGADVEVTRTVMKDGQVYFQDDFATHYMPWRAVYEYGPGTKIPKDKNSN